MTSLVSDWFDALGTPNLQWQFGQSVTRLVRSNANNTTAISGALWVEGDSERAEEAEGTFNVRRGKLSLPEDTAYHKEDSWQIAGELWQVENYGPVNAGLRVLSLWRRDAIEGRPQNTRIR